MDWQPIETAPKDGTEIMLTWFFEGYPEDQWLMQWDGNATNGLFPGESGFWVTPDRSITWNPRDEGGAPTHWRPRTQEEQS